MAIQEYVVSALTDIPPLVSAFANANGWLVTGTSSEPILRHPTDAAREAFKLSAIDEGSGSSAFKRLIWTGPGAAGTSYRAGIAAPRRGTVSSAPTHTAPTKVTLITSLDPEPWLVIIVSFGFNLYRHLYLGHMVKIGNYTGGEVISGTQPTDPHNSSPVGYRDDLTAHLFRCLQGGLAADRCGGVRVVHANNPNPWRIFRYTTNLPHNQTLPETLVAGGFGDDFNDGYLARGKSAYAGSNILVPINLWATRAGNTWSPLGHPPGIRMVNMDGIDPEQVIEIGAKTWHVFPAMRKSELTSISKSNSYPPDETSYMLGYAYCED